MALYQEPFLHTYKTRITNVTESGGKFLLQMEDTIFYPGGGGQPCDTGTITGDNFEARVTEVFTARGEIFHQVELVRGTPARGEEVALRHDIERRIRLVKSHTAEHILFKSIENVLKERNQDARLMKINLTTEESSLFIDTLELNWDILFQAEEIANNIVKENREIVIHQVSKEEASRMEKLRIKVGKVKRPTVRVVEIKDFDWSACTGTHAKTTGFVGSVLITGFHTARGVYEIRFAADADKRLLELSRAARLAAHHVNKPISELSNTIIKLTEENENLKRLYRELSARSVSHAEERKIGSIMLVHNTLENAEKRQIIEQANRMLSERTVVFIANSSGDNSEIILLTSPDLAIDTPKLLLEIIAPLNGRGGGRGNFASGSVKREKLAEFTENIIRKLRVISGNDKETS